MSGAGAVLCVDFGSTFTKAALVDLETARVVATVSRPTTLRTDLLDGLDACRAALSRVDPRAASAEVHACSSAGGGLRIVVVGNEELVSAEAGHRVALSSGGKVVGVIAAAEGLDFADRLAELDPDLVLLVGGTDGGNAEVLLAAAGVLGAGPWTGPVVVAGNADARDDVERRLGTLPRVHAENVMPRIGELRPGSARAAVREAFLAHVIGGKHLSSRPEFTGMLRGATPDLVLSGVEVLARGVDAAHPGVGEVVVIDVGGATTDVHSVVELDPEESGLAREVVAPMPVTRTVEGDLGMRWSAVETVAAAVRAGLLDDDAALRRAAERRAAHPDFLPGDGVDARAEQRLDLAIATAAATIAVRRHAGRSRVVPAADGRVVERSGVDLREVRVVVGSGGVLRADPVAAREVLAAAIRDDGSGWQVPEQARLVVDGGYLLAAVGLLAGPHPQVAARIARGLVGAVT